MGLDYKNWAEFEHKDEVMGVELGTPTWHYNHNTKLGIGMAVRSDGLVSVNGVITEDKETILKGFIDLFKSFTI